MGLRDPRGLISLSRIYSAAYACRRCPKGLFDSGLEEREVQCRRFMYAVNTSRRSGAWNCEVRRTRARPAEQRSTLVDELSVRFRGKCSRPMKWTRPCRRASMRQADRGLAEISPSAADLGLRSAVKVSDAYNNYSILSNTEYSAKKGLGLLREELATRGYEFINETKAKLCLSGIHEREISHRRCLCQR